MSFNRTILILDVFASFLLTALQFPCHGSSINSEIPIDQLAISALETTKALSHTNAPRAVFDIIFDNERFCAENFNVESGNNFLASGLFNSSAQKSFSLSRIKRVDVLIPKYYLEHIDRSILSLSSSLDKRAMGSLLVLREIASNSQGTDSSWTLMDCTVIMTDGRRFDNATYEFSTDKNTVSISVKGAQIQKIPAKNVYTAGKMIDARYWLIASRTLLPIIIAEGNWSEIRSAYYSPIPNHWRKALLQSALKRIATNTNNPVDFLLFARSFPNTDEGRSAIMLYFDRIAQYMDGKNDLSLIENGLKDMSSYPPEFSSWMISKANELTLRSYKNEIDAGDKKAVFIALREKAFRDRNTNAMNEARLLKLLTEDNIFSGLELRTQLQNHVDTIEKIKLLDNKLTAASITLESMNGKLAELAKSSKLILEKLDYLGSSMAETNRRLEKIEGNTNQDITIENMGSLASIDSLSRVPGILGELLVLSSPGKSAIQAATACFSASCKYIKFTP